MRDKNSDKLTYDKLMEVIDSIKMYSGCDEVKLVGNDKSFEELTALGFPFGEFKCENITDMLDESKLYIIPIEKLDEYDDDELEEDDYPCNTCASKDSCDGWEAQFCCTLCRYYNDEPDCENCDPMDI